MSGSESSKGGPVLSSRCSPFLNRTLTLLFTAASHTLALSQPFFFSPFPPRFERSDRGPHRLEFVGSFASRSPFVPLPSPFPFLRFLLFVRLPPGVRLHLSFPAPAPAPARFRIAILMPIATSPSALSRPASFAKMEDRKRPASSTIDDGAPPNKRQATVNGSSKTKDDSGDMKEEAWIEVSVTRQPPINPLTASSTPSAPSIIIIIIFSLFSNLSFCPRRGSARPATEIAPFLKKAVAGASHHRRDVSATDFSP